MKRHQAQWTTRLCTELKYSTSAFFITLTHDEKSNNGNVNKETIQKFLKRLRKHSKFRYYIISEYGPETFRPHYHGLIFGFNASHDRFNELLIQSWAQGFTSVGDVTEASINYCTGYIFKKKIQPDGLEPNFCLMSRNPGIGYQYINELGNYHKTGKPKMYVTDLGGKKTALPRYYAEKLYTPGIRKTESFNANRLRELKQMEDQERCKEPDYYLYQEMLKEDFIAKENYKQSKKNKL